MGIFLSAGACAFAPHIFSPPQDIHRGMHPMLRLRLVLLPCRESAALLQAVGDQRHPLDLVGWRAGVSVQAAAPV
jgi:hypothetical protein